MLVRAGHASRSTCSGCDSTDTSGRIGGSILLARAPQLVCLYAYTVSKNRFDANVQEPRQVCNTTACAPANRSDHANLSTRWIFHVFMSALSRLHGLEPTAIQHAVLAAQALERGDVAEAARQLAPALGTHPGQPELLRLQAGILSQQGNYPAALAAMRQAVAQRPDDALYYNTLGTILGASDDLDGAVAALQRACTLQPELAVAWYNLGVMLTHCVRHEEAIDALRQATRLNPGHTDARALLSDMLRTQGRVDDATRLYREMLASHPTSGMAWWGLADMKVGRFGEDDILRMQHALATPGIGTDDAVPLGFALAKALDDHGQYAASLAALAQANGLARQRQRWSADGFAASVTGMLDAFSAGVVSASDHTLGQEVVFVMGLPRSGTTLVEQILASHSQVQGAGELPDLPLTLSEESHRRHTTFPDWARLCGADDWTQLGRRYLARTQRWRSERPRFVDKLPSNWMYIGAIRSMLPAARIVVCRRDPLETCFSCYRQFLAGNEYARTFEDLAAFWRDFDRSVKFWLTHATNLLYEHCYEQLIANPERPIHQLLAFCELPFEDACLRFHETKREVRSPSAMQVRQPIQRDRARSGQYGALLDPLRAALGLPAYGTNGAPDPS